MNGEVLPLFSQPVYVDTLALDDSMVQSVINTECEYVAADTIGTLIVMLRVNLDFILTSLGSTSEKAGTRRTSS